MIRRDELSRVVAVGAIYSRGVDRVRRVRGLTLMAYKQ